MEQYVYNSSDWYIFVYSFFCNATSVYVVDIDYLVFLSLFYILFCICIS